MTASSIEISPPDEVIIGGVPDQPFEIALQVQAGMSIDIDHYPSDVSVVEIGTGSGGGAGSPGDSAYQVWLDAGNSGTVEDFIAYLIGPAGAPGDPGEKGDPGPPGADGEQGPAGPAGADSTVPGPQGETGPQGPVGPKGDTGDTGPAGPEGPVGPKGDTGDTGPQGETGPVGPEGPGGPQGIQGDPGPKGDTGDEGPQGIQGPAGPQGPAGADGADSTVPGPEGPAGPTEVSGDDGNVATLGSDGKVFVPPSAGDSWTAPNYASESLPEAAPVGEIAFDTDTQRLVVKSGTPWKQYLTQDDLPAPTGIPRSTSSPHSVSGEQGDLYITTLGADPPQMPGLWINTTFEGTGTEWKQFATTDVLDWHIYEDANPHPQYLKASGQITDISAGHTEELYTIRVTGDGGDTGAWIDRNSKWFRMNDLDSYRRVQWDNEYLEWRGAPARNNTVGWRIFTREQSSDATRNMTVPIMEMQADRNTRTRLWAVMPNGGVLHPRSDTTAGSQWTTDFTGTLETTHPDIAQHKINGVVRAWSNEWGAIRGRNPYTSWADSLVRGVINDGDYVNGGNFMELADRRTGRASDTLWGVRWQDGRMTQGGNLVGAVYTLESGQTEVDIPSTLPAGTLIVRKTA